MRLASGGKLNLKLSLDQALGLSGTPDAQSSMMRVMGKTESTQRQAGSDANAVSAEEAGREPVFEQRIPTPPRLAPPQNRRTGALARLLARGSQDGAEVHDAMEDLNTMVGDYVHRELTPLVAAIEARFDVQDAKIDAQNAKIDAQNIKIESLTTAVRDLTGAVAATNAKVERLTAAVAAQNAKLGALYWMFGIVIALFMALATAGVFKDLFSPPSIGSADSGVVPQTTSAPPPEPPSEDTSVQSSPAAAPPDVEDIAARP